MSLYNITVDPNFIGGNGWKSEHQIFFFEEYYSAMCKAFMTKFNQGVAYNNPYDRYKDQDLYHLFDGFKDYMEKTNKAINGVYFPGGGYKPFTEYTIPESCIKIWRFEDVLYGGMGGYEIPGKNDVLIIALVDISHITDKYTIDNIIERHNKYINHLCNSSNKTFYKKLKSLYYDRTYIENYNIKYIALTSMTSYLIYK